MLKHLAKITQQASGFLRSHHRSSGLSSGLSSETGRFRALEDGHPDAEASGAPGPSTPALLGPSSSLVGAMRVRSDRPLFLLKNPPLASTACQRSSYLATSISLSVYIPTYLPIKNRHLFKLAHATVGLESLQTVGQADKWETWAGFHLL